MKIIEIDFAYYCYPNGVSCIKEFVEFLNSNYNSFIELKQILTDNCAYPYFVSEDIKTVYLNVATIKNISEEDVTVLSRAEYDARLSEVVKEKCISCVHYEEDTEGDSLKGHRDSLTLDGECWAYKKKD